MAKILTYDQFKEIVPSETVKFVDNLLPYLKYYLIDDNYITVRNDDGIYKYDNKAYVIMSYHLSQLNNTYQSILSSYNYNSKGTNVLKKDTSDISKETIFNQLSSLFCFYNDEYEYLALTPTDIYLNILNKISFDVSIRIFTSNDLKKLFNYLKEFNSKQKTEIKQKYEEELYKNLPIETVKYLETVSKLHVLIKNKIKSNCYNKNLISDNDEDLYSLSRIFALYLCNDNNVYLSSVINILEQNGLSLDALKKICDFDIYYSDIPKTSSDVLILNQYYKKYIFGGRNKGKDSSDIKVDDVFLNLLDRDFNGSLIFEKILSSVNFNIDVFNDFDKKIESEIKNQELILKRKQLNEFYQDLSKESRDFINFTVKTYSLISKKISENKKSTLINDDVDTLALLISSYYFNTDVSKFFVANGVTLDKILKLYELDIKKKDIENVELSEFVLNNVYKKFVYKGVNNNKVSNNITINNISNNLCNKSFNSSSIIEDTFNKLSSSGLVLETDFYNQMDKFLKHKKQVEEQKKYQEFFHNLPVGTIKYLEDVSKIHQYLKDNLKNAKNITEDDIVVISLLIGIIEYLPDNDKTRKMFRSFGFNKNNLDCNFSNIKCNVSINILKEKYGKYIFGGNNKEKIRKDIDVQAISSNIFNKELYSSVEIQKILGKVNLSYDYFEDFDLVCEKYKLKVEEEKIKKENENILSDVNKLFNSYSSSVSFYFMQVLNIHKIIKKEIENKNCNANILTNDLDIEKISLLMSLFYIKNDVSKFFASRNITVDSICEYCGLDKTLFNKLPIDCIDIIIQTNLDDKKIILENYKKYLILRSYCYSPNEFGKLLFDESTNSSIVIKNLCLSLNTSYNDLAIEVKTGEKVLPVITNQERLELIKNEIIPELDFMDRKSILMFGDTLAEHSKFIHTKLPSLEMNDTHDKSIQTISEVLNGMYQKNDIDKETKNKGFWAKIFTKSSDENNPSGTIVLKPDAISSLKEAIDENIEILKHELLEYDFIQEYIRIFRNKNLDCYDIVEKAKNELSLQLDSIDKDDDRQYEKLLIASANLQILSNKLNQLNTSNHLMKQELLKINQTIINHFITISSLEMARDDLLPLIGSELAINKGKETENQALELSSNIVNLFKAILVRNVSDTVENMEKIKESSIDNSILSLLHTDVSSYLEQLDNYKQVLIETDNLKDKNSYNLTFDNNDKEKVKKKLF